MFTVAEFPQAAADSHSSGPLKMLSRTEKSSDLT
jgi:hypothetical protein